MSNWAPPEGYINIKSALEGVTVYVPIPIDLAEEAPKTFTCPSCGASTHFDVAAGGVICPFCGYSTGQAPKPLGDRAIANEFTLDAVQQSKRGWGVVRKVVHCDTCGAELAIPEGALSTTCSFCASNKVNLQESTHEVLRPRFLIPFKILPESNLARMKDWLGQGWYHPSELVNQNIAGRFSGIYLPFWDFSAKLQVSWEAEVGRERMVHDKNGNSHTEIDWCWKNGELQLKQRDLLVVGTKQLKHRLLEKLFPYKLEELTNYSADFLAGWNAHAYDIPLVEAWEEGKSHMREEARQACNKEIAETHVRNFRMQADFGDETWRYMLLPVYLASYQFENKLYQMVVNGQTGAIAGQKPVAWWKIWLAILGLLSPGLVLGMIGLPLALVAGIGAIPLLLGFGLFVLGGIGAIMLYRSARESEEP